MIRKVQHILRKEFTVKKDIPDVRKSDNASIKTRYSAETEFKRDAVFSIELLTSKTKVDIKRQSVQECSCIYYTSKGKI